MFPTIAFLLIAAIVIGSLHALHEHLEKREYERQLAGTSKTRLVRRAIVAVVAVMLLIILYGLLRSSL